MTALRVLVATNMYPSPDRPYFGIFVARQVEAIGALGIDTRVETIAAGRARTFDCLFTAFPILGALRRSSSTGPTAGPKRH